MLDHLNVFAASNRQVLFHRTVKPKCKTFDVAKANFKCSAKQMFGQTFVKPLSSRPSSVYLFTGGKTKFLPGGPFPYFRQTAESFLGSLRLRAFLPL